MSKEELWSFVWLISRSEHQLGEIFGCLLCNYIGHASASSTQTPQGRVKGNLHDEKIQFTLWILQTLHPSVSLDSLSGCKQKQAQMENASFKQNCRCESAAAEAQTLLSDFSSCFMHHLIFKTVYYFRFELHVGQHGSRVVSQRASNQSWMFITCTFNKSSRETNGQGLIVWCHDKIIISYRYKSVTQSLFNCCRQSVFDLQTHHKHNTAALPNATKATLRATHTHTHTHTQFNTKTHRNTHTLMSRWERRPRWSQAVLGGETEWLHNSIRARKDAPQRGWRNTLLGRGGRKEDVTEPQRCSTWLLHLQTSEVSTHRQTDKSLLLKDDEAATVSICCSSFRMLHINDYNSANPSHLQLWHHSVGCWWLRRGGQDDVKTQKNTHVQTHHILPHTHTESINRARHQAGDPQQTQQVKTCREVFTLRSAVRSARCSDF